MSFMGNLAMQTAMTGIGPAMDQINDRIWGDYNRKKQLEQQKKLTDIQVGANKDLADYGMGISKEMFEATGYGAQRRQMEEAGLNPALMYGHAGAGGTTTSASAGSASGGMASDEASRKQASIAQQGMALQMAKLSSEIAINKASAKKLEAEADKTAGVDTELVKVNILDVTQNIKNKEVQEAGQRLQNDYDKIRNYIGEKTVNFDIGYVGYMAGQAREQWQILINSREISDATKDEIIKNYELMNENIISDILVKNKKANLTDAQANKLSHDILQGWKDLELKEKQGDRKLDIESRANDIKARYPSLNQLGGGILNELIITLDRLNPLSKGSGWSAN